MKEEKRVIVGVSEVVKEVRKNILSTVLKE